MGSSRRGHRFRRGRGETYADLRRCSPHSGLSKTRKVPHMKEDEARNDGRPSPPPDKPSRSGLPYASATGKAEFVSVKLSLPGLASPAISSDTLLCFLLVGTNEGTRQMSARAPRTWPPDGRRFGARLPTVQGLALVGTPDGYLYRPSGPFPVSPGPDDDAKSLSPLLRPLQHGYRLPQLFLQRLDLFQDGRVPDKAGGQARRNDVG